MRRCRGDARSEGVGKEGVVKTGVPMPGGGTALRVSLVAALDRNRAIGRGNALPWHLPDDFRRLRALTMGKPILMGRRPADSLGRSLSGRRNLVLTRVGRRPVAVLERVSSRGWGRASAADT